MARVNGSSFHRSSSRRVTGAGIPGLGAGETVTQQGDWPKTWSSFRLLEIVETCEIILRIKVCFLSMTHLRTLR